METMKYHLCDIQEDIKLFHFRTNHMQATCLAFCVATVVCYN